MAEPTKIKIPWARDDGTKATIPDTSQIGIADGRASFPDGFVPLNGTPKAAGGIPPFKQDMNGILYAVTNVLKWVCSGGLFKRDSTFQTAISGYPIGAILLKSDNSGIWFNTVDDNTSDPDTGGAGWQHIDPRLYATASGSTTAYTATFSPAIAALTNGQQVVIDTTSVGTNTTSTPTFSPNGLIAWTIVKQGGALEVGDLPSRAMLSSDLANTRWLLLNPVKGQAGIVSQAVAEAGTDTNIFSWTAQRVRQAIVKGYAASFTANGYIRLPDWAGNFTLQWGTGTTTSGSVTITLPIAYTTTHYGAFAVERGAQGWITGNSFTGYGTGSHNLTLFLVKSIGIGSGGTVSFATNANFNWISVGV